MSRPLWFVEFLRRVYPARFMVAQATRLPILGKWLGRFFFDGDNMVYLPRDAIVYGAVVQALQDEAAQEIHGAVIQASQDEVAQETHGAVIQASQDEAAQETHGAVVQVARGDRVQARSNGASKGRVVEVRQSLDLPEDVVLPSQVVDHFIDQASDLWIMNACLCRQSEGCEDYPIDVGCLFMGRAVRDINPRLGRLVPQLWKLDVLGAIQHKDFTAQQPVALAVQACHTRMGLFGRAVHFPGLALFVRRELFGDGHDPHQMVAVQQRDLLPFFEPGGCLVIYRQGDRDAPGQAIAQPHGIDDAIVIRLRHKTG